MTSAVHELLAAFDALSEVEKQQARAAILRSVQTLDLGDVPESALVETADELFVALDTAEIRRALH